MNAELTVLERAIRSYLNSLQNFQFYYLNPLFWIFFLFLFLILLRSWRPKKSLSFCLSLAIVLLLETKIENFIGGISKHSEGVDPNFIVRIIFGMLIAFIFIYYFMVRED